MMWPPVLLNMFSHDAGIFPASRPPGHWVLDASKSDEFGETHIDPSKWKTDVKDWGGWVWRPENVKLKGGRLVIEMRYDAENNRRNGAVYSSGIVQSSSEPLLYGYVEARIKGPSRYPGVCAAFWAYKIEPEEWTELDFVELGQSSHRSIMDFTAIAWKGPMVGRKMQWQVHRQLYSDVTSQFHVYGFLWNEKELQWFVDGQEVARRPNEYWHQPLDIVLSLGLRKPLTAHPSPDRFPATMEVDYVRVWRESVDR